MALKIPEAPNIVGGDAVLRSAQGVSGETLTPQFKVDNSATLDAFKEVSSMIINVQEEREETMLQDAATWWTNNMNNQERNVKENFKGRDALNLYNNQMAPYAKKLEEDLFGEPKDDGLVRIADPAMQQRFKLWANKQLVMYNARIGDYEGRELSRYNESTFDAREAQITSMLANADTAPEFIGGADSYAELTARRYPGLNPEYIKQVSSAKVDAAVTENIKNRIATDVVEARKFYLSNPEVSNLLTESSKAAIDSAIQDQWVKQGIARGGEGLAAGDGGAELRNWTSPEVLGEIFGTTDSVQINAIQQKMYGDAKERSDALVTRAEGIADMMRGQQAAQLANAQTDDERFSALQNIAVTDSQWASAVDAGEEKDLALAGKIERLQTVTGSDLAARARQYESFESSFENVANTGRGGIFYDMARGLGYKSGDAKNQGFAEGLVNPAGLVSGIASAVNLLGSAVSGETPEQLSANEARLLETYQAEKQEVQDELRQRTETYIDLMNDVVNGRYVGGYDERLDRLGGVEQKAIYQAVAAEQAFRNVSARYPKMDSALKSLDTKYDDSAMARAKRIFAEEVNKADHNGTTKIDDTRLQQLANYAIAQSRDSVSNALSDAISGTATDNDIVGAGVSAFTSNEALKAVTASDNTYDKQGQRAKKVIRKFRNNLPEGYRSVVDDYEDLLTSWYRVGNTPAILNFVRSYKTTMQASGGKL